MPAFRATGTVNVEFGKAIQTDKKKNLGLLMHIPTSALASEGFFEKITVQRGLSFCNKNY
jgi:hypothetical protein